MARLLLWLARGYAVVAVAAFVLGLVSTFGWFGAEATPLGMVFAVLLAFPWTRLIGDISSLGAGGGLLLLALALAANVALLFAAARLAVRRR